MSNFKLLFSHTSSLSRRDKKKKRRLRNRLTGFSLILIQIIVSVVFLYLLFYLNMIPDKYMFMLVTVLILVTLYNVVSQFTKAHIIGKFLSVLLSICLLTGSFYVAKASSMLNSITQSGESATTVSVIVLNSDPANSLSDTKDYQFGSHVIVDKVNTDKAISQINQKLGSEIKNSTYNDWDSLVNALYEGKIKAIVLNEAYRSAVEEIHSDFSTKTKVIDQITIEHQSPKEKAPAKNVSKEPFTIYIAGNDEYGTDIAKIGRNDVNIIATFNPNTKQVLLMTTPRDYYINLDDGNGTTGLDKLTHAGNFGIDGSIRALENLYGNKLDYYVKMNFTGAVGIIDALGGITVDSEVAFTTTPDTSATPYKFVIGPNECDGQKALAFARERHAFNNGDNQRGRDQMIAIKAMIAKASSPAIITNYSAVLDSVSNMFVTNMPTSAISELVKDTLNDSTPWNVQTYNTTGTGASKYLQVFQFNADVVLPDYDTVNTGIKLISKIKNGEIFDVDQFVENKNEQSSSATSASK